MAAPSTKCFLVTGPPAGLHQYRHGCLPHPCFRVSNTANLKNHDTAPHR
ncbi:hypothetical protein C5167_038686 [Papaver somniferum]|uniref:Uncharacterized protein n=1 Tax=Papaver somniferum TaxID=3469 RepID=A0A4Y7IE14_PAPSO|nr:hypothetical protein C5167_038686 [Papaver somniferum]